MNVFQLAQMLALVGSGVLSQQTSTLLGDASVSGWLSSTLAIFTLSLNLPVGQAADYWGRKWILVISSIAAIAGFVVISRAKNVTELIVGFCISGPSFGCQCLMYAVVSEIIPRKYRSIGQTMLGATSAVGGVTAVLMAGGLLRHGNAENYRIYWYVVMTLTVLGTLGVAVGYNPPRGELDASMSFKQKIRSLDWIGYVLISSGLTLFAIGLQWSKNPYSWNNAHVLAPFILGTVLLIVLVVYEWKGRSDGLFHHALFGDRNFVVAVSSMFIEGLSFFTTNNYFTYEASLLFRLNFFQACLRFSMMFLSSIVTSALIGAYSTWRKSVRSCLVAGFLCLTVYNVLMTTVKHTTSPTVLWGYPIVAGAGFGTIIPMAITAAQLSTPPGMITISTGTTITARGLGAAIGIAVNTAIFKGALDGNLASKVEAAVAPFGFNDVASAVDALNSGNSDIIGQVFQGNLQLIAAASDGFLEAYSIAFRHAWIVATSFSAAGLLGESVPCYKECFSDVDLSVIPLPEPALRVHEQGRRCTRCCFREGEGWP